MKQRLILLCCAIAGLSGAANAGLLDMIRQADAVTIADVTPESSGPNGTHFLLTVHHVLKGHITNGNLSVSLVPSNGFAPTFQVTPVCGIFLLAQDGSQWHVIPQETPLRFDALYMPTDRCSDSEDAVKGMTPDQVIGEFLHSVVTSPQPTYVYRLSSLIRVRESAQIAVASKEFSESSNAELHLLGLSWRIAEGDAAALQALAADTAALHRKAPIETMLVGSLSVYSNVDPGGVAALGAIARSIPGGFLEQAVSFALRRIHNRPSLDYAVQLLDSSLATVRENAIATFSMYVLQVPPLDEVNGHAVFERALNPSTRKHVNADEEVHIHFGPMSDASAESALIQYWREWYGRIKVAGQ
jgi:hypothetical protein